MAYFSTCYGLPSIQRNNSSVSICIVVNLLTYDLYFSALTPLVWSTALCVCIDLGISEVCSKGNFRFSHRNKYKLIDSKEKVPTQGQKSSCQPSVLLAIVVIMKTKLYCALLNLQRFYSQIIILIDVLPLRFPGKAWPLHLIHRKGKEQPLSRKS